MEIIIGRDKETGKLKLIVGTQVKTFGAPESVPTYVSRQHAKLELDEKGRFVLKNLKATNVTYVNGLSIETKHVTPNDKIELGPTRFLLDWSIIEKVLPQIVDIKPLETVWNEYHTKKMKYQVAERKFNTIRSASGLITMAAVAVSVIGGRGTMYIVLYALAIGISLIFFIIAYINSSKMPKLNDELDKEFRKKYVCPNKNCSHFLGFTAYDVLSQGKQCPFCRAQYKK